MVLNVTLNFWVLFYGMTVARYARGFKLVERDAVQSFIFGHDILEV